MRRAAPVRGRGPAEVDSVGGSRWGMVDAAASAGAGVNGAAYGEQVSVDAEGGAVSDFNESEGDNADAFEHGGARAEKAAIDSALADQAESADAASALSTGKMDPQAPGWTRRVRVGKQPPDRAPCPERVGALEKTIKGYADKLGPSVVEPEIGLTFDSLGEAYDFYNIYSWEFGFGIRYGKSRLNAEKTKCMQEVVCGCSGKPIKENSQSCRCECPAMIRLLRTHDNGWYITEHRVEHNHSLSTTCGEKVNWPSHKHIDVYTKDLVKQLRQNNINVNKVYRIIASFFGDVEKVLFTKRTLRNLCGKINKEQAEVEKSGVAGCRRWPLVHFRPRTGTGPSVSICTRSGIQLG